MPSRRMKLPLLEPCTSDVEGWKGSISGVVASFLAALEVLVFSTISRGCRDGVEAWPLHLTLTVPAPLGVDVCADFSKPLQAPDLSARVRVQGAIASLPCVALCSLAVRLVRSATKICQSDTSRSTTKMSRANLPAVRLMLFDFEGVISLWVLAWSEILLSALPINVGLVVWPSCKLLCHHFARCARRGESVLSTGQRVLELGGGVGLLGLLIACLVEDCEVVITDSDNVCLNMIYANIAANSVKLRSNSVGVGKLRFGADSARRFSEAKGDDFDMIVAGDVMYSFEAVGLFLDTVSCLLAPTGVVLLAHPQRSDSLRDALLKKAEEHGFQVSSLLTSADVDMDMADHEPVVLYRFARHVNVGRTAEEVDSVPPLSDAFGGWKCKITSSHATTGNEADARFLLVIAAHPLVHSAKEVQVDVSEECLRFVSEAGCGEFQLPQRVDATRASTKWSKKRSELELRLPLATVNVPQHRAMDQAGSADESVGLFDATFEKFPVRMASDDRRGRFLAAARDLAPGEIAFSEDPVAYIVADEAASGVCHYCFARGDISWKHCAQCKWARYCSKNCYQAAAAQHARECNVLDRWHRLGESYESCGLVVRLAEAMQHDPFAARQVSSLCVCPKGAQCWHQHHSQARKLAQFLPESIVQMSEDAIADVIMRLYANGYKICDSSGEPLGHALFLGGSILNHSCRPNVCVSYAGTRIEVRCLERISKNDELCHAYVNVLLPMPERCKLLSSVKGFECLCSCCAEERKTVWDAKVAGPMTEAAAALVHDACVLKRKGEFEEALRECEAVLACGYACTRTLALARDQASRLCFERGLWAQCLAHAVEAIPLMDRLLPCSYPGTSSLLSCAKKAALKLGRTEDVQVYAKQIVERMSLSHGPEHPDVKAARETLVAKQGKAKHTKRKPV